MLILPLHTELLWNKQLWYSTVYKPFITCPGSSVLGRLTDASIPGLKLSFSFLQWKKAIYKQEQHTWERNPLICIWCERNSKKLKCSAISNSNSSNTPFRQSRAAWPPPPAGPATTNTGPAENFAKVKLPLWCCLNKSRLDHKSWSGIEPCPAWPRSWASSRHPGTGFTGNWNCSSRNPPDNTRQGNYTGDIHTHSPAGQHEKAACSGRALGL